MKLNKNTLVEIIIELKRFRFVERVAEILIHQGKSMRLSCI